MKSSRLKINLGYGLIGLASFALPLGEFKPNRVVKGILLYPTDLFSPYLIMAFFIGILMLYIVQMRKKNPGVLTQWLMISLGLLPSLILIALSAVKISGIEFNPSAARVSLGSGYYVLLLGILIILSQFKSFKWFLLGMVFSVVISVTLNLVPNLGLIKEFNNVKNSFIKAIGTHLTLALSSALSAIIPGILLGYISYTHSRWREWVMGFVNLFQVAPTLSLLGLVMIPLSLLSKAYPILSQWGIKGIGFAPAFIVLTLYCLLPIVANAYAGFQQVDKAILSSAQGMGLTPFQIFYKVSFPLAAPIILSGIRTALTQNIGNTILAGLVGGGGLGALIFLGLSQAAPDLVLLGTIPVVIMALMSDQIFEFCEYKLNHMMGVVHDTTQTS